MSNFKQDLRSFHELAISETKEDSQAIRIELFSDVIYDTPVDEGRARGEWQTSKDTPKTNQNNRIDTTGAAAIQDVVNNVGLDDDVNYLTNNLPYINTLEYGGYPRPPKRGSWVKGKGWVIKTINGYSKKAPDGMVRRNMARITDIVKKAVAKK